MIQRSLLLILLAVILTACQSGSLSSKAVVPTTSDIIDVSDFRWDGIVDTYVTSWYPDTSYGKETTLWVRPGQHFILMQFNEDVAGLEFTVVSRTNEQPVMLNFFRWTGPVTDNMTYREFLTLSAEHKGDLLESIVVYALRPYQVGLQQSRGILIEAEGGGVGYGIASTNVTSKRPAWHPWISTPTPTPTPTQTATVTPTATVQEPMKTVTPHTPTAVFTKIPTATQPAQARPTPTRVCENAMLVIPYEDRLTIREQAARELFRVEETLDWFDDPTLVRGVSLFNMAPISRRFAVTGAGGVVYDCRAFANQIIAIREEGTPCETGVVFWDSPWQWPGHVYEGR